MPQRFITTLIVSGLILILGFHTSLFANSAIHGFVRDAKSTDPLLFCNVVLKGTDFGASTDKRGYYVIQKVPPGKYTLLASYIGYKPIEQQIEVSDDNNVRVDLSLQPKNIEMNKVVVTADRLRFEKAVETSRINLTSRELEIVPAFVEADVFRSIQQLPGVVAQNDFSAALVVRGGSPDENLILLDGIEVYNPYHFGGVFSAFNTDAIRDADFQSGGFPVRYGGRLSSVLEITTKEGNPSGGFFGKNWPLKKYWDITDIDLNVSLLSSKALVEGPILNGAYTFSVRRTYLDQVARLAHSIKDTIPNLPYYFYDLQGRAHFQLSDRHRLDIAGYSGADNLTLNVGNGGLNSQDINLNWIWRNNTRSATLKSIIRPEIIAETMLATSKYDFDVALKQTQTDSLGNSVTSTFDITNLLRDVTFAEKVDWKLNKHHRLQTGLEYKQFHFRFAFDNDDIRFFDEKRHPRLFSVYLQDTWTINALWNLQFGIRPTYYSLSKRIWTDLRGGIKYRIRENTALKLSVGTFTQYLFTSNSDDAVLRIVDFWIPVPEYLNPERAIHYVLGVEQWIGNRNYLSLEGYYKPYLNILDTNPFQSVYNQSDDYIAGKGAAWGFETIFKRTAGRLTGWLAYTYAHIQKRIDLDGNGTIEAAKGEIYSPKYDKRHNLNLVVNYQLNKKNSVGMSWNIASGEPYTPVVGKMFGGDGTSGWFRPYLHQTDISGRKNSARMPYYLRGDLTFAHKLHWFGWDGQFTFQILNITNHFNVLLYQWDHSVSPSRVTATSMFPLTPTFGISFKI